ncbi:Gag-pol polyprotein [Elysia marginata]|uniref:Gag-pol polyprotein n=1 Tax=Elysia marginata TaxID=1093978 RepID=A0AAV4F990_9GAST|nr:Gag-pol polyprotein [Elysia marginata]
MDQLRGDCINFDRLAKHQERLPPSDRFRGLHVDMVGPLSLSQGLTYLFTIIDWYTSWPKASTCATVLLRRWVARFGVPEDITSDRGRQFTFHCGPKLTIFSALKPTPPRRTTRRHTEWLNVSIDNSRHH